MVQMREAQNMSLGEVIKGWGRAKSMSSEVDILGKMATPAGFEPATTRLEGECSIQLSYGAAILGRDVPRRFAR
jgi:hypothetical protein